MVSKSWESKWEGIDESAVEKLAAGERVLAAGGNDRETLELHGTFCCSRSRSNRSQFLYDFMWRIIFQAGPALTRPATCYMCLRAERHFIWLTEQFSRWHRQSLEIRDREMQLHQTNLQLRMLSPEELDQPETRRRIEAQSAAERSNGRRLNGLVQGGEELVRQAMRNPEFGVGHLEKWAEMLQILRDISANRMPNVADLLKQSAQAQGAVASSSSKPTPTAGQVRSSSGGTSKPSENKPQHPVPQVVDNESSQQPPRKDDDSQEPSKKNSQPTLRLPVTTIAGSGSKKSGPTPASQKLDEAVAAQQDLLAEFEKIADELNKVLANLEGSTLVKRLKAASRQQNIVAEKVSDRVDDQFGHTPNSTGPHKKLVDELTNVETRSSQNVSTIMDDMQSYFERRRFQRFKVVLDEMREQDAVGSLRQLAEDISGEIGMSIAQCEFWSDTLDRWADNLVDPACCGQCPGCKSKGSLPPSIVLEAMQILEAEVNLREETRGTEQARLAIAKQEFGERASKLRETQEKLSDRVDKLTVRIRELPDGESDFAKEIALLGRVELVMNEAAEILGRPETGSEAIGAETEAIELLLQSKRINPKSGGGGGSSPGGGGQGNTNDSALALVGSGVNEKEIREEHDVSQATGDTGNSLPEEFRAGLDEYFNQLEQVSQ